MKSKPDSAQATPQEPGVQWTGGQYSLVRVGLGLALFWLFGKACWATLGAVAPFSSAMLVSFLALALTLLITLGWRDGLCGALLLAAWAYMANVEDWQSSTLDSILALLLLLHVMLAIRQPAPYGALSMWGRVDPGASWRMRPWVRDLCWLLLGLVQVGIFVMLLWRAEDPALLLLFWELWGFLLLGLAFVICASRRRGWRPSLWGFLCALLVISTLYQLFFVDWEPTRSAGLWVLLLFLFEPSWVPARRGSERELVFYDGECGLCHRFTRFLLAEDPGGRAFGLAPLQGSSLESHTTPEQRAELPDSIILLRADGTLLTESSAVVHMLQALGGSWRVIGTLVALVPRGLRDLVYRGIARIRKRVFAQPAGLCPILPAHLASRFLP